MGGLGWQLPEARRRRIYLVVGMAYLAFLSGTLARSLVAGNGDGWQVLVGVIVASAVLVWMQFPGAERHFAEVRGALGILTAVVTGWAAYLNASDPHAAGQYLLGLVGPAALIYLLDRLETRAHEHDRRIERAIQLEIHHRTLSAVRRRPGAKRRRLAGLGNGATAQRQARRSVSPRPHR